MISCKISLIIPVYNEEKSIKPFLSRVLPIVKESVRDYEIVFIDDGSMDNTLSNIIIEQQNNPQIRVINFSRNFGKEAALTAGLDYADGDAVIPMDVDLQDPPELLIEMLKKWQDGFDIVFARRIKRDKDAFWKRNTAVLFYWLWNKIADTTIPENVGDYRLLDKKVVLVLRQIREKNRFMKGIFIWVGFKSTVIEFARPERLTNSTSSLSFVKLYKLALNGILSFTSAPLKIWMYIGFLIAFISFFVIAYLILHTVLYGANFPSYASIMVTVLFMGGINLLSIGIIGQYLARVYDEVKNRPIYLIDKIYEVSKTKKIK